MKKVFGIILLAIIINPWMASAKNMALEISYAQFMNEENTPYLEIYFALAGHSVDYEALGNDHFQGGIEVTVTLKADNLITAADKFRLMSPELSDTTDVSDVFINQVRLGTQPGHYLLTIDLTDINQPDEKYHLEQPVEITLGQPGPALSSMVFLDSYRPAAENSRFAKSGYDLIPFVSTGSYFLNESLNQLSFYTEVYNTEEKLGADEPYLLKYYLRNTDSKKILNNYGSYSRKISSQVQPVLASIPIDKLPTGNYELVLQALDREGNEIVSSATFFYRHKKTPVISVDDVTADLSGTFAGSLANLDTLYQYIEYLWPISNDAERNYQQSLLAEKDAEKMKRYLYAFWVQKDELNPRAAWQEYLENVRFVNAAYSSRLRRGYKTDRGRVYLVYGKPDQIEDRRMEPNLPPYQIWQYNTIQTPYTITQTNKFFVFAEFQPSTLEYELLHSTAIGELQSRRWEYELHQRAYGGVTPSLDRNNSEISDWGTRVNDNIIFNSTGSNRKNQ